MIRYSVITQKNPREIVLLKSHPCLHGKCSFCDYISDNNSDTDFITKFNRKVLIDVTGCYGQLEVINSASIFELPENTWHDIYDVCKKFKIHTLYFECHYMYRNRISEVIEFFKNINIVFKCGIETFDNDFRNKILKKGAYFKEPSEVRKYFSSICLLVGIKGQNKAMIDNDIKISLEYFDHVCINLYIDNTTPIKKDEDLQKWFINKYSYLVDHPKVELLINNTDFGVGGEK